MRLPLLLLPLLLVLGACQSTGLQRDFDPSRDFGAYRSWRWQEPAVQYRPDDPRLTSDLTEQRLRTAIAEQLEQRGLRQAASGAADLGVQAWLIVDRRQDRVTTYQGGFWGGPWHGYWGGPGYSETRVLDYRVGTLQIDLFDTQDGKLVWRGSAEQRLHDDSQSPAERTAAIRQTVARVLSQYPPH
ncbi:DUF4136 domain-containing protein [Pseudomonas zhanjiangensis]|uniref:DUF4136 domain-containing protein n=1 Tax=Pseudomonas zhanjiangensis TaxID=3239015 RepID=A0ABV3YQJ6_9PSED